ncbi:MAG TPA: hypothetical protein VGK92_01655 [Gaiellales bacterium]
MFGRRAFAALAVVAGAVAPSTALAGVGAYRASDGSSDPAFVQIGSASTIQSAVPDGAGGAFLLGSIAYGGSGHRIVHLRANGSVDPAFRPQITGGYAEAGAVSGRALAIVGAFTAVDGQARRGLAVLDARTGRPLSWVPTRPLAARMDRGSRVVFAGGSLVASTRAGIFAWRVGSPAAVWKNSLVLATGPASAAPVVVWGGSVWTLASRPRSDPRLVSLDPATGRVTPAAVGASHIDSIEQVGGRLVAFGDGNVTLVHGGARSVSVPTCERPIGLGGRLVAAVGGDARTLYLGLSPTTLDAPGSVGGLMACANTGQVPAFRPPALAYGIHGPVVDKVALIGTHVLVFTRRF